MGHHIRPQHPAAALLVAVLKERAEISATEAAALPEMARIYGGQPRKEIVGCCAYHLKRMVRLGKLEVVREARPPRGCMVRYYALTESGRETPDDSLTLDRIAAVLRGDTSVGEAISLISELVEQSGRPVA